MHWNNNGCVYRVYYFFFFFKQKTAYEMCGRDWSSDVCSSDLILKDLIGQALLHNAALPHHHDTVR